MPCDTLAPSLEILLVDDQRAILLGVAALIDSEAPSMRVAGQASSGRQALALARGIQPDVIVLDVNLGDHDDGLALLPLLRACCRAAVVVFTCNESDDVRARAFRQGADGFVPKSAPGEDLIAAIRRVAA